MSCESETEFSFWRIDELEAQQEDLLAERDIEQARLDGRSDQSSMLESYSGAEGQGGDVKTVAALFCRKDSIYKTLPGVDVWDAERDAMNWPGGMPAVCHPPCGQWGRLAHMAHAVPKEKWLALLAVAWVRMFGGVLEHPRDSRIRSACKLPRPGERDAWNGWTLVVSQKNWGHPAEKPTLLYIVGCEPRDIPNVPIILKEAERVITSSVRMSAGRKRSSLSKKWCEATPPAFAEWLVELARRCEPPIAKVRP